MTLSSGYQFIRFDREILENSPRLKSELLEFYCNIWRYDPNFGEYRKCPLCRKYYSEQQVEVEKVTACSGTPNSPHPLTGLVEAWTQEIAWTDLDFLLAKGQDFFGSYALELKSQEIVGFVWGYATDFGTQSAKWDQEIVTRLESSIHPTHITYLQEIGVDRHRRHQGLGQELCRQIVDWMKTNHSNSPSFLHTHIQSSAFPLFQKAGYRLYSHLVGPNPGRILMIADLGSDLTPEKLKRIS